MTCHGSLLHKGTVSDGPEVKLQGLEVTGSSQKRVIDFPLANDQVKTDSNVGSLFLSRRAISSAQAPLKTITHSG